MDEHAGKRRCRAAPKAVMGYRKEKGSAGAAVHHAVDTLSGGRPQDIGRSSRIDKTIQEAEELTRITRDKYAVKHYFILIEDAIADGANLVLAPDGITGNLIFRSLVFLGSLESHGAVTLGIKDIFIDTSRSQSEEGYLRALKLAEKLARQK